uniref:Truncated putative DD34D transposase n=1 Tax=Bactrocera tryoni TaxID=59916 RepID=A0A1L5BY11_BACRY|nr:truncated putative DD34D transposase [Bactrocera tryoni]
MTENIDQRICVKFCVANEFSCADTLKMLQKAFGESALSKTRTYEWYRAFKEGRETVEDMPRSGRPSTSVTDDNVEKVKEIVAENSHVSLREIAHKLEMSHESVRTIMHEKLGMQRVAARLVPIELNFLQKRYREQVAADMLDRANSDPTFMERIITGDETWVYEYDTLTNQQSSEWRPKGAPKPKKPRQSRSKVKVMLIVFFDIRGVVHYEYVPTGQTVNKEYYLGVMRRLRDAIRRKRPSLWANNSWILHHDNAPSHKAIIVNEFLAKHSTNIIEQAPYSPDMAPCDFFLFSTLKYPLRGTRFDSIEDIKTNSTRELKAIPESAYKKCFDDWKKRWHMCIASNGCYFEGDKINLDDD